MHMHLQKIVPFNLFPSYTAMNRILNSHLIGSLLISTLINDSELSVCLTELNNAA